MESAPQPPSRLVTPVQTTQMQHGRLTRHGRAVVLIALGGIVSANLRYAVGAAAGDALAVTLAVNTVGSFALGVVLAGAYGTGLHLLVSVGFCGAFTTFSSFSFQTVSLWKRGERARAVLNAVANLLVSLLAFAGTRLLVSR